MVLVMGDWRADRAGWVGQVFTARSANDSGVIKLVPKDPGASRELLFVDLQDVPNVVPVWDSGEHNGFWFIVMPRAEQSLKDRLDKTDVPADAGDHRDPQDIADALAALEGRIVHRDLKPGNVLSLDEKWCLADFGISRYAEATTAPIRKSGRCRRRTLHRSAGGRSEQPRLPTSTPSESSPSSWPLAGRRFKEPLWRTIATRTYTPSRRR